MVDIKSFEPSRTGGVVAVELPGAPYTCNLTTGRCDRTAPPAARAGDVCSSDIDCPFPGECHAGRCIETGCADDGQCGGCAGCANGACLDACGTAADCLEGSACVQGRCSGVCDDDSQCGADRRCVDLLAEFTAARCEPFCDVDPSDGVDPLAITCGASEGCVPVTRGSAHGFCRPDEGLCHSDAECAAGAACRVVNADLLGRCEPGCADDDGCTAPARCRIQTGSAVGVCRSPGGPCAQPSAGDSDALLGDAQCIPGQTCNSAAPRELGACE